MMTSAQVVETSVTVTDNSPFQDYPHPDDHTTRSFIFTSMHIFFLFYVQIVISFYFIFHHLFFVNCQSYCFSNLNLVVFPLGSRTSRCSGIEPALTPKVPSRGDRRPDSRKRRKSSLSFHLTVTSEDVCRSIRNVK